MLGGAARALALVAAAAAGTVHAAWTPDADALPRGNRTWIERIADELDRSLTAYRRAAASPFRRIPSWRRRFAP